MRHGVTLLLLLAIFSLAACGPRARINPQFSSSSARVLAILPAQYPAGVQRERVDYIRSLFRGELQSAGYVLIDDSVVVRACSDSQCCSAEGCPERAELSSKYGVNAFARVQVESIARNNFLAGYLNAIDGSIQFSDLQGQEILSVKHAETERGGLLFNSGQILQGVISQIENAGEEPGFQRLASKFVQSLVSQVPQVDKTLAPIQQTQVAIDSTEVRALQNPIYQVCVTGTPGAKAALILNRQRSNLRETAAGRYCGVYNIADVAHTAKVLEVELRSIFGDTARQEVRSFQPATCDLSEKVQLIKFNNRPQIIVEPDVPDKRDRFWIYRSDNGGSSFVKVADTTKPVWIDSTSRPGPQSVYQVVCLDKQGIASLPEPARTVELARASESSAIKG